MNSLCTLFATAGTASGAEAVGGVVVALLGLMVLAGFAVAAWIIFRKSIRWLGRQWRGGDR